MPVFSLRCAYEKKTIKTSFDCGRVPYAPIVARLLCLLVSELPDSHPIHTTGQRPCHNQKQKPRPELNAGLENRTMYLTCLRTFYPHSCSGKRSAFARPITGLRAGIP